MYQFILRALHVIRGDYIKNTVSGFALPCVAQTWAEAIIGLNNNFIIKRLLYFLSP